MKYEKLEKQLIEHCAPTLAGIKSANLFSYFYGDEGLARTELKEVNTLSNERGVYVEAMLWREKSVLIYVYRKNHLQKELSQPEVMELLMKYGYKNAELEDCIHHLKGRLYNYTCFPIVRQSAVSTKTDFDFCAFMIIATVSKANVTGIKNPIIIPYSSHTTPKTKSSAAAKTLRSFPLPSPKPKSPPLAE